VTATEEIRYVYGWGRTKHIARPDTDFRGPGLCGAYGGYYLEAPHRPVCKHCLRLAAPTPREENG
jgi:hypothetical protein